MANLAPHETLELHELLIVDSAEIKKLTGTLTNLRDQDLKTYIQNYLSFKKDNFEAIEKLIDTLAQQK